MNLVVASTEAAGSPLHQAEMLERRADAKFEEENWIEAGKLFQRCLELRRKCINEKDPNEARILDKLAVTLLKRHLPGQAEAVLIEAEKILESVYYSEHASLAPVLDHYADCLIEDGKISQAEQVLKRVQEIYANTVTMENHKTLQAILKLARIYISDSKPVEARAIIDKAMKHVDTPLGPVAEFRYQLCRAYILEGKIDEAKKLLDLCIDQFKQRHNYGRVADCLETYATIAPQSDKNDQLFNDEISKYRRLSVTHPYNTQNIFPATLLRA